MLKPTAAVLQTKAPVIRTKTAVAEKIGDSSLWDANLFLYMWN